MHSYKKIFGFGLLAGVGYYLTTKETIAKPVRPLKIRNDSSGSGHFGASRNGQSHHGTDYLVIEGQNIYSPINGKVTRIAMPYSDDSSFKGCVIENEKYKVKIFYIIPQKIGKYVIAGQRVGTAQDITKKYGGSMKNHIHIEIIKNNQLIDPEKALKFTI